MIGWAGAYCYEHDEDGRLYKRPRNSDKRLDIFPMKTAYIIHDSHDNWILGDLFYSPIARGLEGGKEKAEQVAKEMQPEVGRFEYEYQTYITRGGIQVTQRADVYLIK